MPKKTLTPHPSVAPWLDRAKRSFDRLGRVGGGFTEGVSRQDLRRLFDEDASRAFTVLTGEQPGEQRADEDDLQRFLRRSKAFVVGLAAKLSPPRRLLFAGSLVLPVVALLLVGTESEGERPFFVLGLGAFLASSLGLTLLLALELVDRLRVRDELEVARQLQSELLPRTAPRPPGFEIVHDYRTANEIGGDYYDFVALDDGRYVVAVGDASGHGIGAGLLMAITQATLKTAVELDPRPAAVLDLLNRTLCRTAGRRAFVTLFYSVLDPARGTLDYASAGHPFPLVRRASGEVLELGRGALPLGIRRGVSYVPERTVLGVGDLLVLYSDGLPEAVGGAELETFGFERLRHILTAPASAQEIHARILGAFEHHRGDRALDDDLTLVVVHRLADDQLPPLPA